jgi:SNF2-related domain/Helicase conserved C-terminal domain
MAKTQAPRRATATGARTRERPATDRVPQGWRTTDEEEIERRRARAASEPIEIATLEPEHPVFGTFRAGSGAGGGYEVEIRALGTRDNSCGCPDYRVNGLGTCKHVEAVLARVRKKRGALQPNPRIEIFLRRTGERPEVRIAWPAGASPRSALQTRLAPFFTADGALAGAPTAVLPDLARQLAAAPARLQGQVRLSRHLQPWVEEERRRAARGTAREQFLAEVQAGRRALDVVKLPLYPYQQEGMLHLAFTERALLADEMGLGKTVQAVAACALLRELRGVERVLVISPASLKAEWEEQIARFTDLPARLVLGSRAERLRQYRASGAGGAFFYLANYEQIRTDGEEVVRLLAPDVIVLDEAQRIKNWQSKTAQAVKRLASPYAFVLTGTPVENRIDEIYSLVQFLDPAIFGPLFRFNRDFYALDERGRPAGYRNLDELHRRLQPVLLRRRKAEVETQLPERTVNHYFVPMEPEQRLRYDEYDRRVARLAEVARRRPLLPEELERLQNWLACMRMLCDTPYILDSECRLCPKLDELEPILDELLADPTTKVLVFSEWQRMLELVRERAAARGVGFAWHTGSVPQLRRRQEIRRFKDDPLCRLFLSTDSGGVGLNLQAANVVVNLDLPWNPARLEQRIARAWRKHQTRPVQVVNLITAESLEQRMLGLLASKQALAEAVVDGSGGLDSMPLPSGRAALVERLEAILGRPAAGLPAAVAPADPAEPLRDRLLELRGERLLHLEIRTAPDGRTALLVVLDRPTDVDRRELETLAREHLGPLGGEGSPPAVEILDRAVFAAIERLGAAGFLDRTGEARLVHRSPLLAEDREGAAEKERRARRARALEIFLQGERRIHMAAVLADGGFPVEALPPLREGLEQVLRGLSHGAGRTVAETEIVDLATLAELLAEGEALDLGSGNGALPDLLRLTTRLRGGPETLLAAGEEEARAWIGRAEALARQIRTASFDE